MAITVLRQNLIFVMTILQLKTFKTQITTKTRALVYHGLYDSVAERKNHTLLTCSTIMERVRFPQGADSLLSSWPAITLK